VRYVRLRGELKSAVCAVLCAVFCVSTYVLCDFFLLERCMYAYLSKLAVEREW
jgi:hypothetical protein